MTVTVDSKTIRTDTDCPDCAVLIRMNNGQRETIMELEKALTMLQRGVA